VRPAKRTAQAPHKACLRARGVLGRPRCGLRPSKVHRPEPGRAASMLLSCLHNSLFKRYDEQKNASIMPLLLRGLSRCGTRCKTEKKQRTAEKKQRKTEKKQRARRKAQR